MEISYSENHPRLMPEHQKLIALSTDPQTMKIAKIVVEACKQAEVIKESFRSRQGVDWGNLSYAGVVVGYKDNLRGANTTPVVRRVLVKAGRKIRAIEKFVEAYLSESGFTDIVVMTI